MTFREKPITRLYAFAMAAVFALVLAGCGGGGGTAQMPDPEPPVVEPDPGPTPEEMEAEALEEAQNAAMTAYMAAAAAVAGAVDPVAMTNAQMYADMAKEASDAAAGAGTSAMAESYQMAAEGHRDSAVEAAGMDGLGLTKLANKIINQSAIDNAVLEGKTGDDVPKPLSNAGRVGDALAASAGATAAVAETPVVTTVTPNIPAVPNGSVSQGQTVADSPTALPASARATSSASGPRLTVTLPSTNVDAVTRGETPTSLTTRDGWMGAELVGGATGAANSMTYANVYTDVQATQMVAEYAAVTGTATTITSGVTSVVTGDDGIPGDGSDFAGTYNANNADNAPPVSGLFDCPAATACSISVNDKNELVAIQGYEFRAATGTMPRTDTDYLAWGVWLRVPNAAPVDGTPNAASAGAFASGNDVFTVNAALKGTATYNGVATGMYSAAGKVQYFDADVSLMANFGGNVGADSGDTTNDSEGDDLLGAVTGTVSGIKAGGMDVDGMLTLKKANIIDGDDNGSHAGGFTSTVSGTLAGRAMVGNWGGQFYGPNKATTDKARETEFPTTAAGTFGADSDGTGTDIIRILGSFGTWIAE